MAELKEKLAASDSSTITHANLGGLANGGGWASPAIDNSSANAFSVDFSIKIKTATGTVATGYIDVYLIRSEDGTNYDDANALSDATGFAPVNCKKIGIISAVAATTTYQMIVSSDEVLATLPRKFKLGLVNNSGGALSSTAGDFEITYTLKTVQSV